MGFTLPVPISYDFREITYQIRYLLCMKVMGCVLIAIPDTSYNHFSHLHELFEGFKKKAKNRKYALQKLVICSSKRDRLLENAEVSCFPLNSDSYTWALGLLFQVMFSKAASEEGSSNDQWRTGVVTTQRKGRLYYTFTLLQLR